MRLAELFPYILEHSNNPDFEKRMQQLDKAGKESAQIEKLFEDKPYRKKIYELVASKRMNIKEISAKIGLSYQNTFAHVKILEKYNLVKRIKDHSAKGRPVYVERTDKDYDTLLMETANKLMMDYAKLVQDMTKERKTKN